MCEREHTDRYPAAEGEVAIIGMACVFPKAPDLKAFWQNIVCKVDAIVDPPQGSMTSQVFDPASTASNRIYCKRGGYLGELPPFNPTDYGVMPVAVDGAEPEHFMALKTAYDALVDAGFPEKPFDRERTEVILGRGTFVNRGYVGLMQHGLVVDQTIRLLRELHPEHTEEELAIIEERLKAQLPPFTPETAPGLCHNVMAGIIANRLDLKGPCLVVDAACSSCLIALEIGMRDLLTGKCDVVLIGGVQISTHAPIHMVFSQLGALSRLPYLRPFDKDADGTMLGEGIGMIVLKRREDAIRDGHRIYAVIKGVGTSSDGRGKGLLAPRVEGEELALRRAYEAAGVSPSSIELIEAHGTALPLGDVTEMQALRRVFGSRDGGLPRCALGTVKSMIGHLIPAAGIAGLIKAALSLYHKILPPTLHCDHPNPRLEIEQTPFYLNTETRPWIHGAPSAPRRAGVSAFGFGGVNAHAVLEEYDCGSEADTQVYNHEWDTELCVFGGESRQEVIELCREIHKYLSRAAEGTLLDVAYSLNKKLDDRPYRLAIVASSREDLIKKLGHVIERLQDQKRSRIKERSGIYFFENPLGRQGKLAFMFPGEGSQYVNMLLDLCQHFPEVRSCFDFLDRVFIDHPRNYLPSQIIFPPTAKERADAETRIWQMDGAVDAVTTANRALFRLFTLLGIHPRAIVGHSSGELMALEAAGAIDLSGEEELVQLILAGNRMIEALTAADDIPGGVLLAVGGVDRQTISEVIEKSSGILSLAMDNCPHQFVLCGTEESIAEAMARFSQLGGICQKLSFRRAYHTQRFEPILGPLQDFFSKAKVVPPRVPIYSCMTTRPYPQDPEEIRRYAVGQWARPVRFRETIEAMYDDGYRIFLEVGPKANLTGFVNDTLKGKAFAAVSANAHHCPGITQLNHSLGILAAHCVSIQLDGLYRHRMPRRLEMTRAGAMSEDRQRSRGFRLSRDLPILHLGAEKNKGSKVDDPEMQLKGSDLPQSEVGDLEKGLSAERMHSTKSLGRQTATAKTDHPSGTESHVASDTSNHVKGQRAQDIIQEYLRTMEGFLDAQEQVMSAYLTGRDSSQIGRDRGQTSDLQKFVGGQDIPILREGKSEPESASLGGDSSTVPPLPMTIDEGARRSKRETAAYSGTTPLVTKDHLAKLLFSCISEKTGYPVEMLNLDQNFEADLGIDSIKRLEILGALFQRIGSTGEGTTEELGSLKTVGEIVEHFAEQPEKMSCLGDGGLPREQSRGLEEMTDQDGSRHMQTASLPMPMGKVVRMVPGQEVIIERQLDLEEDLFLKHHTLGGKVSQNNEDLYALPVLPLSMSLEMMAEAASLLSPGYRLIEMKNIRSHDWVVVEDRLLTLEIFARARPEAAKEIEVQLRIMESATNQENPTRLAVEGVMLFGPSYPEAPRATDFHSGPEISPALSPERFYPRALFHGPLFQSVKGLNRCGDRGAEAVLRTTLTHQFFRSVSNPVFLSDPLLLDGAGQAVALWAASYLDTNFVIFPVGLERVRFFTPFVPASRDTICRVQAALEGSAYVCSDIDLLKEDGSLQAQLKGLQHKRVNMPKILHLFRGSRETMLSTPWQVPVEPFTSPEKVICCRLGQLPVEFSGPDGRIWRNVLAYIVLSEGERDVWNRLSGPEKRRTEWLLARIAGKEAVRSLLKKQAGIEVWPADIEIQPNKYGKPVVNGEWTSLVRRVPSLSLTHSNGVAVALAADGTSGLGLGIDIERLRSSGKALENLAFSPEEKNLISKLGTSRSDEWCLRIWCAKEAMAKALGRGFPRGPGDVVAKQLDSASGAVSLEVSGTLSRAFPHLVGKPFQAYTFIDDGFVIASAACEGDRYEE